MNIAFIDGQNLHLGIYDDGINFNYKKFRVYLRDKYNVEEAYYFLGAIRDDVSSLKLYSDLQIAGYILYFREHNSKLIGKKKGNVDTDIVFEMMKSLVERIDFDKIVLVSGDGDYKRVVDYLIIKNKFLKILFPHRKYASSLYKSLGSEFYDYIYNIKSYVEN